MIAPCPVCQEKPETQKIESEAEKAKREEAAQLLKDAKKARGVQYDNMTIAQRLGNW